MGLLDELASKVTETPLTGSTEHTSGLAAGIMQMLNSQTSGRASGIGPKVSAKGFWWAGKK